MTKKNLRNRERYREKRNRMMERGVKREDGARNREKDTEIGRERGIEKEKDRNRTKEIKR